MAFTDVQIGQVGLQGVYPRQVFLQSTGDETAALTAGALNSRVAMGDIFKVGDVCYVGYKTDINSPITSSGVYQVAYSAGNWSLVPLSSPGDITLPTTANHLAYFSDALGTLTNAAAAVINDGNISAGRSGVAGILKSFPATAAKGSLNITGVANTGDTTVTLSNALHGQASVYSIPDCGASTANLILSKTTGTQHITVGSLQVDAGNLSAGISTGGTAGSVTSYSATTTAGFLRLAHVANGSGDFSTTLSSAAAVAQSQVLTVPDALGATGKFIVATSAALVSGNLLKNSGTGGAVVDAGIIATQVQLNTLIKAVQVTGLGGAGAGPLTVTAVGCTAASIVQVSILASSNTAAVSKVVPGSGSFALTLTADPGATLTISYLMLLGAQ